MNQFYILHLELQQKEYHKKLRIEVPKPKNKEPSSGFCHFLDSRSIYPWLSFVNGDWWENSCLKKRRQRRIETHQPQGRNYHITALPLFASHSWQIHRNASDKSDFCRALITYLPQFVGQIQRDNSAGVWFVISMGFTCQKRAHVNRETLVSERRRQHQIWFAEAEFFFGNKYFGTKRGWISSVIHMIQILMLVLAYCNNINQAWNRMSR